jgi:hypothetical protein
MDIFESVIHLYRSVSLLGGSNFRPIQEVSIPIEDKLDAIPVVVANLD